MFRQISVLHINFWCLRITNHYLQDANGPAAEAMLSFSDSVMLLILPIAVGVLTYLLSYLLRSPTHRFLVEHQILEFSWTLYPALLLLTLAAPSLSLLYLMDEVGLPSSTLKVCGHQWYWVYEASDLSHFSAESYISSTPLRLLDADNRLRVHSQLVLRFLVTAADVLHSWALPSWGLKADAVPGRLNQLSTYLERPGIFYGQCSEICGANHRFMPIKTEVLPVAQRRLF